MTIRIFNQYILRRRRQDAVLAKVQDEYAPYVDASFKELFDDNVELSLKDMDEMNRLSKIMNRVETEIEFLESQIRTADQFKVHMLN